MPFDFGKLYLLCQAYTNWKKPSGLENRIFFDLEWNERWNSYSENLFETNPLKKSK